VTVPPTAAAIRPVSRFCDERESGRGSRRECSCVTSSLAGFLLARIAEEHETAVAATVGPWRWDGNGDLVTVLELPLPGSSEDLPGSVLWADSYDAVDPTIEGRSPDREHIARWDPTRVLAGCRSRRRIVHLLEPLAADCGLCSDCPPCTTLRLLAQPYATHRDYSPAWHPSNGADADR
jgi:Family of unknown function (DUF6221)